MKSYKQKLWKSSGSRRWVVVRRIPRSAIIAATAAVALAAFISAAVEGEVRVQQSPAPSTANARQNSTEDRLAFEVASIRRHLAGIGGRGGGVANNVGPGGCAFAVPQIDPRRFALSDTNVWALLAIAYSGNPYPQGCADLVALNLISGGPGWMQSDKWDLEAVIPEGIPVSQEQLRSEISKPLAARRGEYPKLQKMVLTLLEDRFKLVVRREMKEVPAYALAADNGPPKFNFPAPAYFRTRYPGGLDDPDFKAWWGTIPAGAGLGEMGQIFAKDASIAEVIPSLAAETGRPVLNRTGLTGQFNFLLAFQPLTYKGSIVFSVPTIFKALEEQVGLKLVDTKTTVEVWVIDRIERPSEN